jgi:U32 family peptidase
LEVFTRSVPEVLAPAGSLDKLKVAVLYGADAVYLGGQKFSLRSAADNFTENELKEGVEFAHKYKTAVYVVLNAFFHDKDFDDLPKFVKLLDKLKVDAVIVSDIGVIEMVKECRSGNSTLDIHLSTQSSCLNVESAKLWKKQGVTRIVLGREVSLLEAQQIKEQADIEVEMFIHGSMCMAYSGNCVISNYTQGRDSNRGGCAHSCRFEYEMKLDNENQLENKKAFFMSSKDLNGIRLMEQFIKSGINSIKVEGRMKSHHYAGTVTKVYKDALNFFVENGHFLSADLLSWDQELQKVSHREYSEANLITEAGFDTVYDERENEELEFTIAGVVVEVVKDQFILMEVRSHFSIGETLELVPFNTACKNIYCDWIKAYDNDLIEKTNPGTLVKIPYHPAAEEYNLVRKKVKQ